MARPRRDTDSDELFLQQTSISPTTGSAIIQPLRINNKRSPSPGRSEQLAAFPSPRRPTFPGPSGSSSQLPYPDRPAAERTSQHQQRQNSLPHFSPEFRENRPPYPEGKSKSPPPTFGRQTGINLTDSYSQPPVFKQKESRPRVTKAPTVPVPPPESPGGPEPPPKDEGGPVHEPEQLNPFPDFHQQYWPPTSGRYRPGSTASTNTTYGRRGSPVPPETPLTATQEVPPLRIGDFPSIPSGNAREQPQANRSQPQSQPQGLKHPTPSRQPHQSPPPQTTQPPRRPWTPTETPGDNPHGPPTVYQGPSRAETFPKPTPPPTAPMPAPPIAPIQSVAPVVSVAPSTAPQSRDRKGASPPPVGRVSTGTHDVHAVTLEQDFQRMNMNEEPPPSYASLSSGAAAAIMGQQPGPSAGPSAGLTAQGYPDEKQTVVLGAAAPEPPRNHPAFQNQSPPLTSQSTGPARAQTQSPLQNIQRSSTAPQPQQGQSPPLQQVPGPIAGQIHGHIPGQGPGQAPGQIPGQVPGQIPGQLSGPAQVQPQPQQGLSHPGLSTTPQQGQQAFPQQSHGQQTFTPPPVAGPSAPPPLPPDWMAHLDQSSGHYYYIHIPTQRTQWEPPQPEPVPITAPPPTPGFSSPTPGFPNSAGGFPPQTPGFPPQTPGFPPPQTSSFPPQTPGFPPQTPGFPPQTPGFPSGASGFPPQTPGFPPSTPGFPPPLGSPGLPPMHYQELSFGPPPPLQHSNSFPMHQLPLAGIVMYQTAPSNGEYFGPYLRYTNMDIELGIWLGSVLIISADPQPPTVHLHQSQDLSPNPRQLKANPIFSHRAWTFYRYDIDIQMADVPTHWTYAITSNMGCIRFEFLVAGRNERTWRWVAHSCNDFSVSVKPEEKAKLNGPGHMWNDLMQKHHETGGFHVQIGGGDQIYADRMWKELPLLKEWLQIRGKENRKNAPWTSNHEEEVSHAYFHYYSTGFDQPHIREAWASIPHILQIDDHDIFDGFGSYPEYMQFSNMFKNIGRLAIHWYLLFQHHTTLDILKATPDERDLFTITGTGWHFIKYLGPSIIIVGADTRAERNPHQVMAGPTYQGLFPRIANLPGSVQHIVLMLAVPIVYPRLEMAESVVNTVATSKKAVTGTYNLLGKVVGSAAGVVGAKQVVGVGFSSVKQAFGKSGLMSSVVSVFGEVDLLDDLRDHWTHESKDLERTYLVRTLQGIAHQRGFRFTFLSGDVHCCGAGLFHDPNRPQDHKTMYQIISSAIVNVPPPPLVLKMLHTSSQKPLYIPQNGMRSTHSISDTKEDMIELFQTDVLGGVKEGKKLMGRRNYAIFVAFEPQMPPGMAMNMAAKPSMGGGPPLSIAVDFIVQGEGMYPTVKYGPVVVPRVDYGQ